MSRIRFYMLGAVVLAAGCGGNGNKNPSDIISGTADLPPTISTPTSTVTAPEGTPLSVPTTEGGTETGFVMGGDEVASGEEALTIPDELPISMEEDPDSVPDYEAGEEEVDEESGIADPDLLTSAGSNLTRAPRGTILWHPSGTNRFRNTGLRFAGGRIRLANNNQAVERLLVQLSRANKGRTITVRFVGPLTISPGGANPRLRVGKWVDLVFQTRKTGRVASYPTRVDYQLPGNNGTLFNKRFDVTTGRAPAGVRSTLTIRKSNGNKEQFVLSNSAKLSAFRNTSQDAADRIPQRGVSSIRLSLLLP